MGKGHKDSKFQGLLKFDISYHDSFPFLVKYQDLKLLIKQECNISDFILDNLVAEGDGTKKVRIGVTDEREGSYLMKSLEGYRMGSNILRVVPVGKPAQSLAPHQSNFDHRGGYAPRNDYNSPQGQAYSNRPGDPVGRPDMPNRPDPWNTGNQWGNQPVNQSMPQNNFGYQQPIQALNHPYGQQQTTPMQRPFEQREHFAARPAPDQGYGFGPKTNVTDAAAPRRGDRSNVLRSVEIIDEPLGRPLAHPARYPNAVYDQQKPITIAKDNFQGPQYNVDRQNPGPGPYQSHPGPGNQAHGHHGAPGQSWNPPVTEKLQQFSKPSPTFHDKKYAEATLPDKRPKNVPESSRNIHDYPKDYDKGPRFSPRRDMGRQSPGRRMSPSRRLQSPTRRISPGRRASPGRRPLSNERRGSPSQRRAVEPHKPGPRGDSPRATGRHSPSRRHLDKSDKYGGPETSRSTKDVRPAYEPHAQAPNRAMYSGGYRPTVHENVQYPVPGLRQDQRPAWPQDKPTFAPAMKKDEDRRDPGRMPKFEPRIEHQRIINTDLETKNMRSPRKSRSPARRDRSPVRDRYKKHSPSPRSPRRSWALEKRRSPEISDAPPPPIWPGQGNEQYGRPPFQDRDDEDKKKRMAVWERSPFDDKADRRDRRPESQERRFQESSRGRREPSPRRFKPDERYPHQPKFEPREPTFESREPKFEPRDPKFESRQPTFQPRDPKFEPRQPTFQPRDPKFEPRQPTFEPRDPKFEPHQPKFEPRELKFEPREPKFEPREPKFEPNEPKFEPRQPTFEPRETFQARGEFPDQRGDFRRPDANIQKRFEKPDFRDPLRRPVDQDDMHRPGDIRHEPRREEFPRREDDRKPKTLETFDKEFEDIYKRAVDFKKKTEELRRGDRRREGYQDKDYDRKFKHEDNRQRDVRDEPRPEFRHDVRRNHDEFPKREPEWKLPDREDKRGVNPDLKAKREKAVEEISQKILHKYGGNYNTEMKKRVIEELKVSVERLMRDMFGNEDVSFIEMVVKFNARYDGKDEAKIFNDIMLSFPSHFKGKRSNEETHRAEVPAKSARRSPDANMKQDMMSRQMIEPRLSDWNVHPSMSMMMPQYDLVSQMPMVMQSMQTPLMVPAPSFIPQFKQNNEPVPDRSVYTTDSDQGYNLYLCKDDFEPYSSNQADYLKKFLVHKIVQTSETGQGWSPDLTLKGLQSLYRYELVTKDESTRDWILSLDFSEFDLFNVLVYTKEELWFERAAVWLPGHSRCRNIEPLTKLKLQNKKLEGVNIGKWKFVKKIITAKGTRVYVDMPPSSARALETHKMMLSYELQKVNVFLKAVAVDKDAFDAGLKETSVSNQSEIIAAVQNSPMPSLGHDPNIVKIALKGNKAFSVSQARKIKEMIIYHIFRYHQNGGSSKTDFIKFGFCQPGHFGVLPENTESKRWLMTLNIGKLNRHAIVVLGADESSQRYIKMSVVLKHEHNLNPALIFERLKQSNQGVKGLNFSLWKPGKVFPNRDRTRSTFEIEMDLESIETLRDMDLKLDYMDDRHNQDNVSVEYKHSEAKLDELIKKYKAELNDSYDLTNMDLGSSDEDDDIVYVGEVKK